METIRNKQSGHTDADFWANYGSVNPRVCLMVKVIPKAEFGGEDAALGFTSNTRDMTLPGHSITFSSAPGILSTELEKALDEPMSVELSGIFGEDSFNREDAVAGKWSFALLELFVVCWDNVNLGEWVAGCGYLGQQKIDDLSFTVETRGKMSLLSNEVSKVTANLCRVIEFGDFECKKDLDGFVTVDGHGYDLKQTLTLSGIDDNFTLKFPAASPAIPDGFFNNGKITALGDTANGSLSREIKLSYGEPGILYVKLKRRFPFALSGSFLLTAGCDRTLEKCMFYENVINRRAEDYAPTIEGATKIIRA